MFKGNIYITSSQEEVISKSIDHVIICISGETHNYKQMIDVTNAVEASILLPPYEASIAEMDQGDMAKFQALYFNHLSTNEHAVTFIALILKVLLDGRNVILYLTDDEMKMSYIKYFCQYFREYLGITLGFSGAEAGFDTNYTPFILNILFMTNMIDAHKFLSMYPVGLQLSQDILVKLVKVLNPYTADYTLEGYAKYFNEYRKNLQSSNKALYSPFMKGE